MPQVLGHPRYRLHVFTSRGRHLLQRQGRLRMPLGYAGAFLANTVSRKAMGGWLERVVFSDAREPLPLPLHDYRTQQVPLSATNLQPSILASCSIPFWLDAVQDIPGAPRGAYWDGGITDYHLHLDYGSMPEGLVLYPHFQKTVIPGWLDKALKHRHRATAHLDKRGAAVAAAGVDRHAAERQAARPQRLQGLRRRPGRPHRRLEPRAARKPAPGGRVRGSSSARAGRSRRCRWPETTIRAQTTNKDGKGSMVMTPRTTGFVTET